MWCSNTPVSSMRRDRTCTDEVCVTCSGRGPGGRGAGRAEATALVEVVVGGRAPRSVDVSLVEPVAPGDLLLVHAGVA